MLRISWIFLFLQKVERISRQIHELKLTSTSISNCLPSSRRTRQMTGLAVRTCGILLLSPISVKIYKRYQVHHNRCQVRHHFMSDIRYITSDIRHITTYIRHITLDINKTGCAASMSLTNKKWTAHAIDCTCNTFVFSVILIYFHKDKRPVQYIICLYSSN